MINLIRFKFLTSLLFCTVKANEKKVRQAREKVKQTDRSDED